MDWSTLLYGGGFHHEEWWLHRGFDHENGGFNSFNHEKLVIGGW